MIKTNSRTGRLATVGAVAALALGLAACGPSSTSSTSAANTAPASAAPSMPSADPTQAMTGVNFGPGCAKVPADAANPGSFDAMAKVPVATAASGNPILSTLVAAVKKAKLVDTLNGLKDVTVFAPDDEAFGALDKATLAKALAHPNGLLKTVLTYHVVPRRITPEQLAHGSFKTVQGGILTTRAHDGGYEVNGGPKVVCGNVQTANATVYIIDGVLLPKG